MSSNHLIDLCLLNTFEHTVFPGWASFCVFLLCRTYTGTPVAVGLFTMRLVGRSVCLLSIGFDRSLCRLVVLGFGSVFSLSITFLMTGCHFGVVILFISVCLFASLALTTVFVILFMHTGVKIPTLATILSLSSVSTAFISVIGLPPFVSDAFCLSIEFFKLPNWFSIDRVSCFSFSVVASLPLIHVICFIRLNSFCFVFLIFLVFQFYFSLFWSFPLLPSDRFLILF